MSISPLPLHITISSLVSKTNFRNIQILKPTSKKQNELVDKALCCHKKANLCMWQFLVLVP